MKTLDLNAYGVCEMNDVEMSDVDGGGFCSWLRKNANIIFAVAFSVTVVAVAIATGGAGIILAL